MRLTIVGWSVLTLVLTQAAIGNPVWKAVPGHPDVFVDVSSIVHPKFADSPLYHCTGDIPSPPSPCRPPPADTKATVKADGAISEDTDFYCSTPGMEIGDVHFGIVGGEEHVVPMEATKLIVCGASK